MNKYILFAIIFLYLVVATLIADSLAVQTTTIVIEGTGTFTETSTLSGILDVISTFWKIVSFQIDLPFIVVLIFFYPATFIVVFMIVDVVKDLIPFT